MNSNNRTEKLNAVFVVHKEKNIKHLPFNWKSNPKFKQSKKKPTILYVDSSSFDIIFKDETKNLSSGGG
jgi:hypothetical protein